MRLHIEKSKAAAGKSLDGGAPAQPNNEANPMGAVRPNDREPPPAKTEDKPKDETKPEEAKKEESKKEEGNKEEENSSRKEKGCWNEEK